ncbi:plastocyanin/azurin family copper-binding protein [Halobaculum halobium]|uniref:Plastocyanin/azurin family copper-binding protein n=1 Tax=Halobaculum halobium TaxID=3032281 RepID=A0ABD5TK98_9EURY|nr:plastocyanin/azurin family copper-binding protein [Halobaculum sp. SYNS20]
MYVTPGTTVTFDWVSDGHNVLFDQNPGDVSGHEPLEDEGFSFEVTFETTGTYEYYCDPHRSLGMVGTVEVVEQLPTPTPQPAGPPEVPDSAKSLGIASFIAMVSTLGLAFFFTKYGGDYEPPEQ